MTPKPYKPLASDKLLRRALRHGNGVLGELRRAGKPGLGLRAQGLGGLGFRVQGLGLRVFTKLKSLR